MLLLKNVLYPKFDLYNLNAVRARIKKRYFGFEALKYDFVCTHVL